jgi:bacterioferritin (cytochrome b1)
VRLNRRTPGAGADVQTLNQLLAAEYYAIAAYTAATPLLSGPAARVSREFLGHEVLHADRLISLIQRAGGQAQQPKASYDLGHPATEPEIMQLLLRVERAELTAYLQGGPALSPGSLRAMAASIFAAQAQHAAIWRLQLGQMPTPTALVTGNE